MLIAAIHRRLLSSGVLTVLLALALWGSPLAARPETSLSVLGPPGSLPSGVLKPLRWATGIHVALTPCPTAECLLETMEARPGAFDLLLCPDYVVPLLARAGRLESLEGKRLYRTDRINPTHLGKEGGPERRHSLPYRLGSTGLIVRLDKVRHPPRSWSEALDPAAPWAGRLGLLGDRREALGAALLALGYPANTTSAEHVARARDLLLERRQVVAGFSSHLGPEKLRSGEWWVAQGWSTDALALVREGIPVRYVLPEEGALLWLDVMAIPRGAPHIDQALRLMDHLLSERVAARGVRESGAGSPLPGAARYLPPSLLVRTEIQPGTLPQGSVRLKDVGRAQPFYDAAWQSLVADREGL